MDLKIGNTYVLDKKVQYTAEDEASSHPERFVIDPYDQASLDSSFEEEQSLSAVLYPRQRWLVATEERIQVPNTCKGDVQLRSTWARLGLIIPATVADPGFIGNLTIELFNANVNPILIRPGDALICMIYSTIPYISMSKDEIDYGLHGRYQGQTGITLPKALIK